MSSHGYKLEQKFKKRLIDVLYELLDTAGAISQGRGPCDAQLCFVQLVSDFDYHEVNLSKVPGILLFVGKIIIIIIIVICFILFVREQFPHIGL